MKNKDIIIMISVLSIFFTTLFLESYYEDKTKIICQKGYETIYNNPKDIFTIPVVFCENKKYILNIGEIK